MRMKKFFLASFVYVFAPGFIASAQPETDTRAVVVKTVNTVRQFRSIQNKGEWQKRAKEIREQVLVSCGLWPMPEKTPLQAKVFGKLARDGYSIEKVYFQSYPGFYVAGNLYRPLGRGAGPFPGILNPHGHWDNGRMANEKVGSIAARCINFARQGMVAFSYDMTGYNDTFFPDHGIAGTNTAGFYKRHRRFATNEVNLLWNINLMALQTWNSIRAVDFLESLADVDKTRLACTGESGGGTQTFILGAIDERLTAQAPVVMVSHTMQGGCSCENAPGLRVEHSNVEIAAAAAPRPQIYVGATGDWTKETLKVEGPATLGVYKLFNAADKFHHVVLDYQHNYNQASREAVYDFFGKWLQPVSPASKESPYEKEKDSVLRVFPDDQLPSDALPEQKFIDSLIRQYRGQLDALQPRDKKSHAHFKAEMLPAWRHTLQVEIPKDDLWVQNVYVKTMINCVAEKLLLGRKDKGDRISTMLLLPLIEKWRGTVVVLAHPEGKAPYLDKESNPIGIAKLLLEKKIGVLLVDTFLTGEAANWELINQRQQQVELFFTTYNRTDTQERVQDLITVSSFVKNRRKLGPVLLCGEGKAGLWSLLAAPAVDGVIADCAGLDSSADEVLLQPDLFVPGLRKIGGFEGVAMLAAPDPLLLHNTGQKFSTDAVVATAAALKSQKTKTSPSKLSPESVVEWIAGPK